MVVFYSDDTVWHERLVLLPRSGPETYWVFTPDDDLYEENLKAAPLMARIRSRRCPTAFGPFPISGQASTASEEDDTLAAIQRAWETHKEERGPPRFVLPKDVLMPDGTLRCFGDVVPQSKPKTHRGKGPVLPAGCRQGEHQLSRPPTGSSWRVADLQVGSGEPRLLPLSGKDAVLNQDGLWVRLQAVLDDKLDEWLESHRRELFQASSGGGSMDLDLGILAGDLGVLPKPEKVTLPNTKQVPDEMDVIAEKEADVM